MELFDGFAGTVSAERAEQYLNKVEPYVAAIETLHKWVTGDLNGNVANFKEAFPDFEWSGSVVFMPNFFGFDAGLGTIKGKDYLVFGLDTIAKMDGAQADLSVLTAQHLCEPAAQPQGGPRRYPSFSGACTGVSGPSEAAGGVASPTPR